MLIIIHMKRQIILFGELSCYICWKAIVTKLFPAREFIRGARFKMLLYFELLHQIDIVLLGSVLSKCWQMLSLMPVMTVLSSPELQFTIGLIYCDIVHSGGGGVIVRTPGLISRAIRRFWSKRTNAAHFINMRSMVAMVVITKILQAQGVPK